MIVGFSDRKEIASQSLCLCDWGLINTIHISVRSTRRNAETCAIIKDVTIKKYILILSEDILPTNFRIQLPPEKSAKWGQVGTLLFQSLTSSERIGQIATGRVNIGSQGTHFLIT